jgi:hypothetical protein
MTGVGMHRRIPAAVSAISWLVFNVNVHAAQSCVLPQSVAERFRYEFNLDRVLCTCHKPSPLYLENGKRLDLMHVMSCTEGPDTYHVDFYKGHMRVSAWLMANKLTDDTVSFALRLVKSKQNPATSTFVLFEPRLTLPAGLRLPNLSKASSCARAQINVDIQSYFVKVMDGNGALSDNNYIQSFKFTHMGMYQPC